MLEDQMWVLNTIHRTLGCAGRERGNFLPFTQVLRRGNFYQLFLIAFSHSLPKWAPAEITANLLGKSLVCIVSFYSFQEHGAANGQCVQAVWPLHISLHHSDYAASV